MHLVLFHLTLLFPLECENVSHGFMKNLQELLEDDYKDFESLENVEESRKHKLYDSDSVSGLQLHTQSSPGERSDKFS